MTEKNKILLVQFFLTLLLSVFIFGISAQNNNSQLRINHNNSESNLSQKENKQSEILQLSQSNENTHNSNHNRQAQYNAFEKDAVYANRKPENELVERRDRTSKHFRNHDGSIEAFLSTGSVNYLENGKWHTIERAIVLNNSGRFSEYEFANTKNAFKSFYSNNQHNGIKTIIENHEITEWQNKKIEFYDAEMNLISSIQSENSEININHAKASYANIFPHTEAQITQLHDGRKIDYEITSAEFINLIPENAVYLAVSEDITLPPGWTATYYVDKLSEDQKESKQKISIFNSKNEEILQYQPPVYFEKENQNGIEDPVGEYQIAQNGQTLTIKTMVDASWIRDEERNFPVVIDPTLSVYPNNTTNHTGRIYSDGVQGDGFMRTGRWTDGSWIAGYARLNTSSIPASSIVTAATGYINITSRTGTNIVTSTWAFTNCANTTTTSGVALYNSITTALSQSVTVQYLGWRSSNFTAGGNTYIENSLSDGFVNIGVYPMGTWSVAARFDHTGRSDGANRPYLSVTYEEASACTATPTPGNTISSENPTCPDENFTLSLQNTSSNTGISYQWQSSSDGVSWSNISGAINATFVTSISAPTHFRCNVTCDGHGTGTSNALLVNVENDISCYCSATANTTFGDGITGVVFNTIDNSSSSTPGYTNFTTQSTTVQQGQTIPISVWVNTAGNYTNAQNVYIDWNQNGVFEPSERYDLGSVTNNANGLSSLCPFNITVPVDAAIGTTYMRVISGYQNYQTNPCQNGGFDGEVEDYTIIIEEPGETPLCTNPIYPTHNEAGLSTNLTISWDEAFNADSYDIYFGEDNPPASLLGNTEETSYQVSDLDYATTYYWQIIPKNVGGEAEDCVVWNFTTGAEPPIFHNYGGTEQLTFNNAAYKADAPNFRISHSSTMEEVHIQISQDVTFPGSTVFDGTFSGSFSGENNFETSLSGDVLDNTEFPQPFDTDVLTHGTSEPGYNTWFAPEYNTPISHVTSGGNPGGRVGFSGSWNNNWGNFLRLPQVDATGMEEITLTFDVWHSHFVAHPNDKLYLSVWADGGFINLPQTVTIVGSPVSASENTGSAGYAFEFTEERDAANVEVTLDISGISDKSSILLYLNPSCGYHNSNLFYVYFDNISVTGADQEFTPGTTYYARARGKIGGSWTGWTSDTYSFTYKAQEEIEWYQNMEPQLLTNTLSDVITQAGPDYATIPASGGTPSNPFTDPSFETGTGWSVSQSYSVYETYITTNDNGTNGITHGSHCAKFAEDDFSWQSFFNGEYNNASQQVDLTEVTDIVFDVTHWRNTQSDIYNCGVGRACKVVWSFKVIIGDAGTSGNNSGIEVYSWTPTTPEFGTTNNNDVSVDISSYGFTGVKTVKFSRVVTSGGGVWYCDDKYYLDNIRGEYNATQTGTIMTTPINLSSFYGDDIWNELSWDQTLNGGTISMSIEEDNGGTWTPVAGLTDITEIGDGVKTIDISPLGSTSRIRLVTEFTESGAKGTQPELNNWTITSKKDTPLPVTLLHFNLECNGQSKEFNWQTATEINNHYFIIQESDNAIDFYDIGKVYGAGNSSTQNYYEFQVNNNGEKYYRLKQVDYDGTYDYSKIITANCDKNYGEISVFPNPFNGAELNLLSSDKISESQIIIYDTSGRIIRKMNYNLIEGNNIIHFGNPLAQGAYMLEIQHKTNQYKPLQIIVR